MPGALECRSHRPSWRNRVRVAALEGGSPGGTKSPSTLRRHSLQIYVCESRQTAILGFETPIEEATPLTVQLGRKRQPIARELLNRRDQLQRSLQYLVSSGTDPVNRWPHHVVRPQPDLLQLRAIRMPYPNTGKVDANSAGHHQ